MKTRSVLHLEQSRNSEDEISSTTRSECLWIEPAIGEIRMITLSVHVSSVTFYVRVFQDSVYANSELENRCLDTTRRSSPQIARCNGFSICVNSD